MENQERSEQAAPQLSKGEMSEAEIDRNLAETSPASDPPSWTLGTDHREEAGSERSDVAEDGEAARAHESKTQTVGEETAFGGSVIRIDNA